MLLYAKKTALGCWAPASKGSELVLFSKWDHQSLLGIQLLMLEGGWKTCASPVTLVVPIDIDQTNPEVILHRWGVISHTLSPSPYYVQPSNYVEKCGPENPARLHKDHGRLSNVFPVSIYVNKLSRTKNINICTGESYIDSTTTTITLYTLRSTL